MNTRIQVEHGVTEAITGWDLVQAQIRLAAGTLAPCAQHAIRRTGAAIECRLYAENPARHFMPSPGKLARFCLPAGMAGLRVDTGVREGDAITPFYDPMIAKLIAYGTDREAAIATMQAALGATVIEGIRHNAVFLGRVLDHADFRAGRVDTGFVERELAVLVGESAAPVAVPAPSAVEVRA